MAYKQGCTSGHYTKACAFSVMFQNDIQAVEAVDSDRSTFVRFADQLTLSVLVKGTQELNSLRVRKHT